MPRWLKVVLVAVVALLGVCGLGVGGIAWWLNANKEQLRAKGEAVTAEAKRFAEGSDSAGCLREALARLKASPGFMDEVSHRVFLGECLRSAARAPGFCEGVPSQNEIMQGAFWANASCAKYDGPREACTRIMQEVMTFCGKAP